ncbi:MAG: Gfo/Idh/MocA family oxidoreductase, partial [Bacteroidota bacterium]
MIKFAVIGAGHIGKRHAEMIKRHDEAQLTAICDVRPIEDTDAEKFGVPYFNKVEDLFNSGID